MAKTSKTTANRPGGTPPSAVMARMRTEERVVPEDKLEKVRAKAAELRELTLRIAEAEEKLDALNARRVAIETRELPDLFSEVGIRALTLEPVGNMPACEFQARAFYSANIKADWSEEQREKGFAVLKECGAADLIKTRVEMDFGRGTAKLVAAVRKFLRSKKIDYSARQGVHSQTLTAWLKEQIEEHNYTPPLEPLGATVGVVVKIKQAKKEK